MSTGRPSSEAPLELRGVSKRFGETVALDGVDLVVRRGTVHALLGENGAGKSTLMRIAAGFVAADGGEVRLFGKLTPDLTAARARHFGVGMVHQHLSLVGNLSVAENLVLGGHGRLRPGAARAMLHEVMESSGLRVAPDATAQDLSIVEQQRLEILKALARNARLLILDEPTAVLAPADVDELLRWIRSYVAAGGSVVLVTHKLREALAISDDVTVLRRGRVTYQGQARSSSEAALARAMFPEQLEPAPGIAAAAKGEAVVVADRVQVDDGRGVPRIRNATFRLYRHEIVGVAAVEGSGHRELLTALASLRPPAAGSLSLPSRCAFIPADRTRDALIPEFALTENVALRNLGRRKGRMPWQELASRTATLIEKFAIVASSPGVSARTLSGGNQQRLVVARELEDEVDLVVADNPTRGLDLRATAFVHEQLRRAAAQGAAVVLHSSDLDEILSLASRMIVVFHGELLETGLDRDVVGRAMVGAGS